jgi:DNA-binding beta-propeller fold protein YncE
MVSVINGRTNTVRSTIPVDEGVNAVVVNSVTSTVYVTNELGTAVSVISGRTDTVIGNIAIGGVVRRLDQPVDQPPCTSPSAAARASW